MQVHRQPEGPDPPRDDRRRSSRFSLVVPVSLHWQDPEGQAFQSEARATEGNTHGGFIETATSLPCGTEILLNNLLSCQAVRARVVRLRRSKQGAVVGIAVEFV